MTAERTSIDRLTAAWSHLAEHHEIESTVAAFPDMASATGDLDRDVLELYVTELDARADAADAYVREQESVASGVRTELAVTALLRTCERLRDQHGITPAELELAAVVVAVIAGLEVSP